MRITTETKTIHFTNTEAINLWSLETLTISLCIGGIWQKFELRTDDKSRLTKSYLSISLDDLVALNHDRWVKRKLRYGNKSSEWNLVVDCVNGAMGLYV